ncbi:MAG: hypothetical protein Q9204_001817 [Flavoplaca sp. TL-2023a]
MCLEELLIGQSSSPHQPHTELALGILNRNLLLLVNPSLYVRCNHFGMPTPPSNSFPHGENPNYGAPYAPRPAGLTGQAAKPATSVNEVETKFWKQPPHPRSFAIQGQHTTSVIANQYGQHRSDGDDDAMDIGSSAEDSGTLSPSTELGNEEGSSRYPTINAMGHHQRIEDVTESSMDDLDQSFGPSAVTSFPQGTPASMGQSGNNRKRRASSEGHLKDDAKRLQPNNPVCAVASHLPAKYEPKMNALQGAAEAYAINPTSKHLLDLTFRADRFAQFIEQHKKNPLHYALYTEVEPSRRFANFLIKIAMEQNVSDTLRKLRQLPRRRETLEIRGRGTMQDAFALDPTKARHLEAVMAHLVGTVAERACGRCRNLGYRGSFFCDCIKAPEIDGQQIHGGNCTSCALLKGKCSDEDF